MTSNDPTDDDGIGALAVEACQTDAAVRLVDALCNDGGTIHEPGSVPPGCTPETQ